LDLGMGGASKTQAPVATGSASNHQLYPLTDDDNPITEEEAERVPAPVPGVSPTLVDVDCHAPDIFHFSFPLSLFISSLKDNMKRKPLCY